MNLEYFIAKRLNSASSYKSSASSTISKIAIVAIALGMVMMIIAIAVTYGLQGEIRQKVSAFNGDILVSNFDGNNSEESINPISINQDFYPDFEEVPEVTHVQAITTRGGIIRTATDFEGVIVKGIGNDYDWPRIESYIVEGRKPDFSSERLSTEGLFSTYLADRLGFKVGDRAQVIFFDQQTQKPRYLPLTIVGLYKSAYQEYDKVYIMADRRQLARINRWEKDEVGAFEVFVDDFDNIESLNNEVYQNSGSFLRSMSVLQRNPSIFQWIKLFDFNMLLIIVVMILVGGVNMIVALLVLVLERTRMIGVFKALGANDWMVRKIFIYNAMYLIGSGLFWGNLIGLGLILVQKYFGIITLNPETYYVETAPVYINFWHILFLNIGVFVMCVLMLLVPSYIITKVSPVKAIRFE